MKRNLIRLSTVIILTALAAWIWSERAQAQRRARNSPNQPTDYRLGTADQLRPTQLARPPVGVNNRTVPAQPTYPPSANQATQSNWATNTAYREPPNPQQIKISNLRSEILFRAEDDKQREEKLTELQTLLEESFDKGIKSQGDELAELEKRVAELKKSFERRKTNRDRVIANYVDSVRLQAEGLTIPALGNAPARTIPQRQTTTPSLRTTSDSLIKRGTPDYRIQEIPNNSNDRSRQDDIPVGVAPMLHDVQPPPRAEQHNDLDLPAIDGGPADELNPLLNDGEFDDAELPLDATPADEADSSLDDLSRPSG